jgi:hypothetical protein
MFNNLQEEPKTENTTEEVKPSIVENTVVEEAPKAEEPAKEEPVVVGTDSFARSTAEKQEVGAVADGAIGVATAKPAPVKKAAAPKKAEVEKVAIHSTKNVTWSGVGKVYIGHNLVTPAEAEKWLTRSHIRTATPEEVAKEFGK